MTRFRLTAVALAVLLSASARAQVAVLPAPLDLLSVEDEEEAFPSSTTDYLLLGAAVAGVIVLTAGLACQQDTQNRSCLDQACGGATPSHAPVADRRRGIGLSPPLAPPTASPNPLLSDDR